MISEKHKPELYKKARNILKAQNSLIAIGLTVVLAVFVNFIELACTIGLPALFTKILADRKISVFSKYFHMVLYNFAYVVPLLVIVLIFTFTLGSFKLGEKGAKWLKFVSGALMLSLGILLLINPQILF